MAAHRAQWKGFIKFGEVSCGVSLYTAASTSGRIAFNTINQDTGNRVRREFVDSETGKTVPKEQQVKGFQVENGQYIELDSEEVAAAVPEANKMLDIRAFIDCHSIDDVYFDKPYYLTPSDRISQEAFVLLRDGMRREKVAAIARTVLFRRVRTVLIRPHGKGLIATTLNYDYEVRSSKAAFEDIPTIKIDGEMLQLANHIIGTKIGTFDPASFDDRYEEAVAELVKAKTEGRSLPRKKEVKVSQPNDLLAALRESAGVQAAAAPDKPKRTAANANTGRQKAARKSTAKSVVAIPQRKAS